MNKQEFRFNILVGCLLLTILVAIPYFPVSSYDYIGYDDDSYVVDNPYVKAGLSVQTIHWAFTCAYSGNWHPLTWMSHMLDCMMFGIDGGKHHWINLIFHIFNTLLLFTALCRMTGYFTRSFLVAALFGIHPLHVESVAWISERKDVLSTLMAFLSLHAYVTYVNNKENKDYFYMILLFALSLMSKPMTVTFPFVLLLLDYWPLNRINESSRRIVLEKIPLICLSILSCYMTIWAQHSWGAIQSLDVVSMSLRLTNAMAAYGWYITKMIAPINLTIFYPHPEPHVEWIHIAWGFAIILTGFLAAFRFRYRSPYIMVGLLWFLGTLIPVIGLVQVGLQAYADRYSYVPLTGLFIIVVWGFFDWIKYLRNTEKDSQNIGIFAFLMIIVGIYSYLCSFQVQHWKNGHTVFEHALQVVPDNYVAMTHMGTIPHLKTAVLLRPNYIPALYNLATLLIQQENHHEALKHLLKAEALHTQNPNIYNNTGAIYYQFQQYSLAREYFIKALNHQPNYAKAQKNLRIVNWKLSHENTKSE